MRHSPADRAALVQAYTPLVRRLAWRIYQRRIGGELQMADLVQLGMVGLLESIDRYSPERGARFETFAHRRIEGAILNGLADHSELHSQLAFKRELARERAGMLREQLGATSRPALEQLAELAIGLALGFVLEDAGDGAAEPSMPDNAYVRAEVRQLGRQLARLLRQLPEAEQRVITRHYFQQQDFSEIAEDMALSRGRISQLHHAGLTRLRQALSRRDGA